MKSSIVRLLGKLLLALLLAYLVFAVLCFLLEPVLSRRTPGANGQILTTDSRPDTERILCLDDNTAALEWRLRAIDAAQEKIALSTFQLGMDESATDVMAALRAAAQRGVRVQLLVDGGLGSILLPGCDRFQALAATPGVEIRFYNRISPLRPWKANYRLHDKYLLIDDSLYILGGRNTLNLFLGNYQDTQNVDRDLLVCTAHPEENTSIDQIWAYFAHIWDDPASRPVKVRLNEQTAQAAQGLNAHYAALPEAYPNAYGPMDWAAQTTPVHLVQYLVNPSHAGNKTPELWKTMQQVLRKGTDVTIQTPYIICDKDMYADLTELAGPGRRLTLLTNAVENGANPWGCTDYLNQKQKILATGAEVYEYARDHSLHAKAILVDDSISFVGSFNLDMRSAYLDTESMLYVESPELNAHLRRCMEEDMTYSRHVAPDGTVTAGSNLDMPSFTLPKKFMYGALRLILPAMRHLL